LHLEVIVRSNIASRRFVFKTRRVIVIALYGLVQAYAQPATSAEKPIASAPAAVAATAPQAEARSILMRMAEYMGTAQRFSVSVRGGYDAVQKSGRKIEFGESRKITLSRPDRLRIEGERSDGAKTLTVFDGKQITLVDARTNVYATAPQPGSIDESIVYFVRDLGLRLPLAALLVSRLPAEFQERVRSVDYVEKTSIYGSPSHHLAATTDTVDFQIWVSDGDKPLPVRVVLTYKKAPGAAAVLGAVFRLESGSVDCRFDFRGKRAGRGAKSRVRRAARAYIPGNAQII
jgi:hypothetical protein